ncbi:LSU ribosomal protein L12AE [Methanolobus vulcani]|jgi:large subunit ribosomal protein L12|uniref:Large ribosomal subunit protein P1 n=1 Tax=Methanolobus vulcani TaxID=38026 RepID=A0A7Z7B3M6_9EURY|nr:50S ribosomal protein P1 [Methanolobus vulcani]MDK2825423.1 large subunit ribosomal protein [Methanolobus sp.]MDK2947674.1 large subunit ribosomal protein [Methanolobus sp.]SDG30126.1 LSU ribosomal protein L12AE [Methanolobus vulcani]
MEYIYAALLLYKAGKDITEEAVTAVLQAAGVDVNDARAKALVAALDGVDIEEAMATAAVAAAPAAAPAAAAEAAPAEEEAAAEEEEDDAAEESGMAGLGALFG